MSKVRTLQMHVTALQTICLCLLTVLAKKDPDLVGEVIHDEALTDIMDMPELAQFPRRDRKQMQDTIDAILRPLRTAIGPVPPFAGRMPGD